MQPRQERRIDHIGISVAWRAGVTQGGTLPEEMFAIGGRIDHVYGLCYRESHGNRSGQEETETLVRSSGLAESHCEAGFAGRVDRDPTNATEGQYFALGPLKPSQRPVRPTRRGVGYQL